VPTASKLRFALLPTTAVIAFSSVTLAQTATEKSTIAAPVSGPAAKADPDMAKVLAALAELGPKSIETLTPSEARRQYSATDAVKKVIKDEKLKVDPHAGLSISNSHFADMGNLRLRSGENERRGDAGLAGGYDRGSGEPAYRRPPLPCRPSR
jgi:hypothetical protein